VYSPEPIGCYAEALSLLERFRQQSDLQSLMACVEICEALLAERNSPAGAEYSSASSSFQLDCNTEARESNSTRHHVLIHLARTLQERYFHTGHESDLDAAIAQGQVALNLCDTKSTICPTVLVVNASLLRTNFDCTGNHNQLHMAESMCRQALALCTPACSLSAMAYHTLGWIMYRLFERVGTSAYIDEALSLQRRALNVASASYDAEDHQCLQALAAHSVTRNIHLGNPQDIEDAKSFIDQASELCPATHINRMLIIQGLLDVVRRKYYLCGRLEDLIKGIEIARQTMATPNFPRGDRRLSFLNALANLRCIRYHVLSTDCDLKESVGLRREVLQYISPTSIFRWTYAANLAQSLQFRFMRKGELQDLEESIELYRRAIDLLPESHYSRPELVSSLGAALCRRFHETRNAADLDETLVLNLYAMAAMSPLHVNYWDVAQNAVSHLCVRFEVFQAVDDLDQAILLSESLLKTVPDGHIEKDETARYLAKSLLLRGADMNSCEDVDRAIREAMLFRERLARSVVAPEVFRTLAASYLVRFRLNQNAQDAIQASDVTNELLDVVGPSHHERFQCLIHAAELYLERGTPFCDIATALKHASEAMLNECRDVRSKLQGANSFLDIVRTQYRDFWTTASPTISAQLLDIYISSVSFLPRVAFFGLHHHSRLQSLAMGQSIALDGASHALSISLPERALEILEQGRVVFWNHTLQLRSPFDRVPDEFRARLRDLARQLGRSSDFLRGTRDSRTIEREAARRRQQSEEFSSLVDQVRRLPGMKRFLLHDEYATLAKAAQRGPVVVLVSSALACHAIILNSVDGVSSLPLASITESWLDETSVIWRTEVIRARSDIRDSRKMVKTVESSRFTNIKAENILERLWTFIVYPVLSKLGLEVCYFP
jgi:tetratricopeptide (TPR) repeat protein